MFAFSKIFVLLIMRNLDNQFIQLIDSHQLYWYFLLNNKCLICL